MFDCEESSSLASPGTRPLDAAQWRWWSELCAATIAAFKASGWAAGVAGRKNGTMTAEQRRSRVNKLALLSMARMRCSICRRSCCSRSTSAAHACSSACCAASRAAACWRSSRLALRLASSDSRRCLCGEKEVDGMGQIGNGSVSWPVLSLAALAMAASRQTAAWWLLQ